MVKQQSRFWTWLYGGSDLLTTYAALALAYSTRFHTDLVTVSKGVNPFTQYLLLLFLVTPLWPVLFYFHGLYNLKRLRSRTDELFSIVWAVTIGTAITLFVALYARVYYLYGPPEESGRYEYSQLVMGLFVLYDIVLILTVRTFIRRRREARWRRGVGLRNILIAGAGRLGRTVADKLIDHQEFGFRVVGFLDDRFRGEFTGHRGVPVLGGFDDIGTVVERTTVDSLYIALPLQAHDTIRDLVGFAKREALDVKVAWDYLTDVTTRAGVEDLDGMPIINLSEPPIGGWHWFAKRAMDVAVSSAALALLAVPFAIISLLIKLTSKGPVLYKQERMGLDGKPFTIVKFRSMYHDAEKESGPVWATSNDPRRTPIGRVLRRFSLDELPQFLNVLKGEMSLVGPRPERPSFVKEFKERIPQYMMRHKVKSGMTGWAQINGWRGDTSLEKRIEHDLYYIQNWSLGLDLKILWRTWRAVLQKHAY
ncbi:MAG TPA: undecaprenyl-phosphate glucose phosphotransferase [Vicinamibacteria bacterium]|nr:undecaprenyl-phosphate glucose phosphotransferase [Vicinamibacteria bacterium]